MQGIRNKYFVITVLMFLNGLIFMPGHAQIVINNGGIIYINGGVASANKVFVVLNSPPATPISMTNSVAAQGIRMETEFSKLKYNLGTGTTAITVPYLSWNSECFPLTVNGITAGVGATGAICFSSVPAGTTPGTRNAGWDNNTYKPTQVSNMWDISGADNSAHTIDRFWIIEPVYYTTMPAVTLNFTYINAEAATNGAGNIASLTSTLMAQRFDTTSNQTWNGFGPSGTNTTGGTFGTVTGVTVASTDFYPDWTLNDYLVPLPVQLVQSSGECVDGHANLKWTTATENNSSHFTVEKSTDGIFYNQIAKIPASGNSNSNRNYHFTDNSSSDGNNVYYKLSETDLNNKTSVLKNIVVSECSGDIKTDKSNVFSGNNHDVVVNVISTADQPVSITAYDMTGRVVLENTQSAVEGSNTFNIPTFVAPGIYLFQIKTNSSTALKKIVIENKN